MYSGERQITKSTGIYRCIDDISNFSIRVQIKEVLNESLVEGGKSANLEAKNFQWQQKIFGKRERNFYKDKNNCVTDLDHRYHDEVVKILDNDDVLYSYVNSDEFCLQEEHVCNSKNVTHLLNGENFDSDVNGVDKFKYDMLEHFEKSLREPFYHNEYEFMYIMADFGEFADDTWIKHEYILCCLKYDYNRKILFIYPDFSNFYPYWVTVNNNSSKIFEYTVENIPESIAIVDDEQKIFNKISNHERKLKDQIIGTNFILPPRNKLYVHLFFEILSAQNFEYNDIYVQYFIDLPENWTCSDQNSLRGTTQACHTKPDDNLAYFGIPFDVVLSYDIETLERIGTFRAPCIYFEVISKDSWDRYRTEGLAYKHLPVSQAGSYSFELQCLRILSGSLSGNLRRFFIGDYKSYDDVTWIAKPKDHNDSVLNKYGVNTVGTGQLNFRLNILNQSKAFIDRGDGNRKEKFILDKLASSTLIKSVEEVLAAFKRARRNMIEAREKIL